jgi:hydroxymethylglutaryl-CoA lyase
VYCPYVGPVSPKKVHGLVERLVGCGAKEIVLSDTTGHANPVSLSRVLDLVLKKNSPKQFSLHLHDTRALALSNALRGLDYGIARFDSSVAGMGGCPYAPGASGNLASEDLVNMLSAMALLRGADLGLLAAAGRLAERLLGKKMPSKVLRSLDPQIEASL